MGAAYGGYAHSRFANMDSYASSYGTAGWQRAKQHADGPGPGERRRNQEGFPRRAPAQIQRDLVARSSVGSAFAQGARVFHSKFGPGTVAIADGNKLTVDFDKAGRKMVLESFVEAD